LGAFSDYLEDAILDLTINQVAYVPDSSDVYVALHISSPMDDDSGVEVTGGAYARVLGAFTAASGGTVSNSLDVSFPPATAPWGTVTHFAIYDDATGGNLLYWAQLTTPKIVSDTDVVTFKASNLIISLN